MSNIENFDSSNLSLSNLERQESFDGIKTSVLDTDDFSESDVMKLSLSNMPSFGDQENEHISLTNMPTLNLPAEGGAEHSTLDIFGRDPLNENDVTCLCPQDFLQPYSQNSDILGQNFSNMMVPNMGRPIKFEQVDNFMVANNDDQQLLRAPRTQKRKLNHHEHRIETQKNIAHIIDLTKDDQEQDIIYPINNKHGESSMISLNSHKKVISKRRKLKMSRNYKEFSLFTHYPHYQKFTEHKYIPNIGCVKDFLNQKSFRNDFFPVSARKNPIRKMLTEKRNISRVNGKFVEGFKFKDL